MRLLFKKVALCAVILGTPSVFGKFNFWFWRKTEPAPIELMSADVGAAIKKEKKKPCVRVLLAQAVKENPVDWVLACRDGFLIHDNQAKAGFVYRKKKVNIQCKDGTLYLNGKKVASSRFTIKSRASHYLTFQGNEYHGFFRIEKFEDKLILVNVVDLEEYVFSVLNSESWPGWPLEINKAFAISCRSYVTHKIYQSSLNKKLPYDIKNTNIHQTYNGVHASETLRRAVNETKGLILTHDGKPIDAMFDSCCGGIVPSRMSGIDFKKFPYLNRTQACKYCKSCKIYGWRLVYPIEEFEKLLNQAGHRIKKIRSIKVIQKDAAGIVERVAIKGNQYQHYVTGKQLYALCPKIKSFCFSASKQGNTICFVGRGYGHHLGICQWGARKMLDAGYHYRSILSFYYPSTKIQRLTA